MSRIQAPLSNPVAALVQATTSCLVYPNTLLTGLSVFTLAPYSQSDLFIAQVTIIIIIILVSIYQVSGISYILIYLILIILQGRIYYYTCFADEETKAENG